MKIPSVYEAPTPNEGIGCQAAMMLLAVLMFAGFALAAPPTSVLQIIFACLAVFALVITFVFSVK